MGRVTCRSEPNFIRHYLPYKMAVNTTPMNSNTRGGGAINLSVFRCQVDPTGGRLQRGRKLGFIT